MTDEQLDQATKRVWLEIAQAARDDVARARLELAASAGRAPAIRALQQDRVDRFELIARSLGAMVTGEELAGIRERQNWAKSILFRAYRKLLVLPDLDPGKGPACRQGFVEALAIADEWGLNADAVLDRAEKGEAV